MAGRARRVLAAFGVLAALTGLVVAIGAPLGLFSGSRPAQLGLSGGELSLPFNTVVAKEFDIRGAFRFHEEFVLAVETLARRAIDVARERHGALGWILRRILGGGIRRLVRRGASDAVRDLPAWLSGPGLHRARRLPGLCQQGFMFTFHLCHFCFHSFSS